MFINPSTLKKLIKREYKGRGIRFGYFNEGIVVSASNFSIWFDAERVPNSIKSIIVEFLGQIPSNANQMMLVSEDKPFAQIEMKDTYTIPQDFVKYAKVDVDSTRVMIDGYGHLYNLYQNQDFKTIFGVDDELVSLYDVGQIDTENGETYPTGPLTGNDNGFMLWKNEASILLVMPTKVTHPVIETIQKIDFEKKEGK